MESNYKRHYIPTEDKPHHMAVELEPLQAEFSTLWTKYKNSRQRIYKFENGYSASAIQGPFSLYGEWHPNAWEIATIDPQNNLLNESITIVDTEEELQEHLDKIARL